MHCLKFQRVLVPVLAAVMVGQLQASSPHSQASHLPREAGVVLELELIAFFNPWHTLANGSCCRDECSLTCSNRFQFCLQPYQQSREEVGGCVWGRYSTGVVATDSTVFQKGQLLEAGTPNPLVFTAHGWTGGFQLRVTVEHIGPEEGAPALVADFWVEAVVSLEASVDNGNGLGGVSGDGEVNRLPIVITVQQSKTLVISYTFQCSKNYFGQNCSEFCEPHNDGSGHYVCDGEGRKVCLEDYRNSTTNCTECASKQGCYSSLKQYFINSVASFSSRNRPTFSSPSQALPDLPSSSRRNLSPPIITTPHKHTHTLQHFSTITPHKHTHPLHSFSTLTSNLHSPSTHHLHHHSSILHLLSTHTLHLYPLPTPTHHDPTTKRTEKGPLLRLILCTVAGALLVAVVAGMALIWLQRDKGSSNKSHLAVTHSVPVKLVDYSHKGQRISGVIGITEGAKIHTRSNPLYDRSSSRVFLKPSPAEHTASIISSTTKHIASITLNPVEYTAQPSTALSKQQEIRKNHSLSESLSFP